MKPRSTDSSATKATAWLKVYAWPLVAVVAWLVAATAIFGGAFWRALATRLADVAWWAETTWSVIFLSVAVAWLVAISQRRRARLERAPFEGWTLELRGLKDTPEPSALYWEDVRRIRASAFEEWKFIKSAVSTVVRISTRDLNAATSRWLRRDDNRKRITVDFSRMRQHHDVAEENWEAFVEKLAESPNQVQK